MSAEEGPLRIGFFGHNAADAAVRRRAVGFAKAGFEVIGFMPRRGPPAPAEFALHDLGETFDNAYLHRLWSIGAGAARAVRGEAGRDLRRVDLVYARNLDMLATAAAARRRAGLKAPLVYECLDVHHKLAGDGAVSAALRAVEGRLLDATSALVLSSPGFEREYFAIRHPGRYRSFLVENRLIEGDSFPPRPAAPPAPPADRPLRLGWFGNLRCARSFAALARIAERGGGAVQVVLRGYPARGVFPDFEARVAAAGPHLSYEGAYKAPEDLAAIYADVDLVWAGDYYEAGANSLWLLPNRIYEGGYFATPPIAPAAAETGRWIAARGVGFTVEEPMEPALEALIDRLRADPGAIATAGAALAAEPRETFVETSETLRALVALALDGAGPETLRRLPASRAEA